MIMIYQFAVEWGTVTRKDKDMFWSWLVDQNNDSKPASYTQQKPQI
jgi:hypothetical protein